MSYFIAGTKLFNYLSKIENWRLYEAKQRGLVLYEFKSDNIIEIMFSWCKQARTYSTPYYVLFHIIFDNIKLMSSMYKSYVIDNSISEARTIGITERYFTL